MVATLPSLDRATPAFPLPSIPEDTLDYAIYLAPEAGEDEAEAWGTRITSFVTSLLTQPWLWNKDSWELKAVSASDERAAAGPSRRGESSKAGNRLQGRMRVGDAVDDEWLVVWLLREVSRNWPELVISIKDTDGEFLLIEAANELPSWVSPENADNRVWLTGGHLHLIPLTVRSSAASIPKILDEEDDDRRFDPEAYLSPEDGVRAARTGKYRASQGLEAAVWARVFGYPKAMKDHLHRTKAYLPLPIAKALKAHPELIQRAVEAFYVRDPAQLRAAAKMTHFPPAASILSSVLLTRPAYAQLQGQVFHPPRVFGPEWTVADEKGREDERRWRDLGVKIATGFEIMYREGGRRGRSTAGVSEDERIRQDAEYAKYLQNLGRAGWWGQEKEGSAAWKLREEEALKGWKQVRSADTATSRPSFAALVDDSTNESASEAKPTDPEDSASWLEISPEELDGILSKVSGAPRVSSLKGEPKTDAMDITDEDGKAITDLAKKVQDFVGGEGDMAGARFADELSDEDFDDASEDSEEDVEMTTAEKDEKARNLVPALPAEEWGLKNASSASKARNTEDEPVKMRPPKLAKDEYDGVVYESDTSSDEDEAPRRPAARKTDGATNQIASISQIEDEEDQARKDALGWEHDFDQQMLRRVTEDPVARRERRRKAKEDAEVGAMEVDMQNELDDFMKFTKDMLGIDEEQWERIVESREERGAFVPPSHKHPSSEGEDTQRPSKSPKVKFAQSPVPESASIGPGETNMDLNTFEKVMAAMDAELTRGKSTSAMTSTSRAPSAKSPNVAPRWKHPTNGGTSADLPADEDLDSMSGDELAELDREIRAALRSAGVDSDDEDDPEEVGQLDGEGKREYRMMKDFLESYKSQGGQAGAVGNLFGRLGQQGAAGKGKK